MSRTVPLLELFDGLAHGAEALVTIIKDQTTTFALVIPGVTVDP